MDGIDSLLDEDVAQSPDGDEPARSGVQPETGAEHLWNATSGCLYARVGTEARFAESFRYPKRSRVSDDHSVSTRPRSKAPVRSAVGNGCNPSEAVGRSPSAN